MTDKRLHALPHQVQLRQKTEALLNEFSAWDVLAALSKIAYDNSEQLRLRADGERLNARLATMDHSARWYIISRHCYEAQKRAEALPDGPFQKDAVMDHVNFDLAKKRRLRAAYTQAARDKAETFTFEGKEYLTRYAYYLLEYLDTVFPG